MCERKPRTVVSRTMTYKVYGMTCTVPARERPGQPYPMRVDSWVVGNDRPGAGTVVFPALKFPVRVTEPESADWEMAPPRMRYINCYWYGKDLIEGETAVFRVEAYRKVLRDEETGMESTYYNVDFLLHRRTRLTGKTARVLSVKDDQLETYSGVSLIPIGWEKAPGMFLVVEPYSAKGFTYNCPVCHEEMLEHTHHRRRVDGPRICRASETEAFIKAKAMFRRDNPTTSRETKMDDKPDWEF